MSRLRIVFLITLGIFFLTACIRFFYQPSGGHVWRQTDTMGMSLVFANSWRSGEHTTFDLLTEPRVLQSGDGNGVNASEFPILNFLAAVFWVFPPRWAAALSVFFLFILHLCVVSRFLNDLLRRLGWNLARWETLAIYFSITLVAERAITFMPEALAFPLSIVGAAAWIRFVQESKFSDFLFGFISTALAVLSKPTMVVVFPLVLILFWTKEKQVSSKSCWTIVAYLLALVPGFYWYTAHSDYLRSIGDEPQYFRAATFEPLHHLIEFGFQDGISYFFDEILYRHFPFIFGIIIIVLAAFRETPVFILYLVAFVALSALGGNHVIVHQYYLLPCGLFAIFAVVTLWVDSSRYIQGVTRAAVLIGLLWSIRCNVFSIAKADMTVWDQGAKVSKMMSPSSDLVTDDFTYPRKLLALGRSGAILGEQALNVCADKRSRLVEIVVNRDRFENSPDHVKAELIRVDTESEAWALLRCRE